MNRSEKLIRTEAQTIRVSIIEDHAIVRAGLRMLIENQEGMEVVSVGCRTYTVGSFRRLPSFLLECLLPQIFYVQCLYSDLLSPLTDVPHQFDVEVSASASVAAP